MAAHGFCEGVGHAATEYEVVDLVHEVFDDADFCGYFRSTHDGGEGATNVLKYVVDGFHFFLHKVAEHLVVFVERIGDYGCRGVFAVGCSECVVDIYVGIACKGLGKLLLAFFHLFFCCFVDGIGLFDAGGLAFFFGVEAEVFEEQHFAGLECLGCIGGFSAVVGKLHFAAESLGYIALDLREGEFGVDLTFGLAHVAHDDEASSVVEYLVECGEGSTDTGVVSNVAVLVKGNVEVNTYDGFFAVEVKTVDCHRNMVLVCRFVYGNITWQIYLLFS